MVPSRGELNGYRIVLQTLANIRWHGQRFLLRLARLLAIDMRYKKKEKTIQYLEK
jgi:hypothetical protein